jgi:hypothetical protein
MRKESAMTERTTVAVDETAFDEASEALSTLVDELGAETNAYAKAKKTIKEYEEKRKILVAKAIENKQGSEAAIAKGIKYTANITAAQEKRTIADKKAIYDALGNDSFVALANFSLGDLDKYLNPEQLDKVLEKDHTGARKVTVTKNEN